MISANLVTESESEAHKETSKFKRFVTKFKGIFKSNKGQSAAEEEKKSGRKDSKKQKKHKRNKTADLQSMKTMPSMATSAEDKMIFTGSN